MAPIDQSSIRKNHFIFTRSTLLPTMTRRLATAALLLIQKSLAFTLPPCRSMSKKITSHQATLALAPLDQELEEWASSSGFGGVDKAIPAGSSGWASFRKVTVTDPPTNDNDGTKPVSFFVKSSSRSSDEMFHGEALGLNAMYACSHHQHKLRALNEGVEDSLRIPKVYHYGDYSSGNKGSFLIMEYLNLAGRSDDRALG